jgi:hypothetical protein
MRKYLLTIYQPDGTPPAPDVLAKIMRDVDAVRQEMIKAGVWIFSGGLHPPTTATVVRVKDGKVLTTDGPYIETKEFVGGFTVIQVPDLDVALKWGEKTARATTLPIEVRPFRESQG